MTILNLYMYIFPANSVVLQSADNFFKKKYVNCVWNVSLKKRLGHWVPSNRATEIKLSLLISLKLLCGHQKPKLNFKGSN